MNQIKTVDRQVFTIQEFCDRNRISRQTYYNLKKRGLAPREMRHAGVRISIEEEAAWRRARSNPDEAEQAALAPRIAAYRERSARALGRAPQMTSGR